VINIRVKNSEENLLGKLYTSDFARMDKYENKKVYRRVCKIRIIVDIFVKRDNVGFTFCSVIKIINSVRPKQPRIRKKSKAEPKIIVRLQKENESV
jgi:hypothetical protein